eukprot:5987875-Pleurochrysis_carterae.AAC.1
MPRAGQDRTYRRARTRTRRNLETKTLNGRKARKAVRSRLHCVPDARSEGHVNETANQALRSNRYMFSETSKKEA